MKTVAVGIRIPIELLEKARQRAQGRKITFNQWANKALKDALRSHTKKL